MTLRPTQRIKNVLAGFAASLGARRKETEFQHRRLALVEMTPEDEAFLLQNLNFQDISSVENMALLQRFSAQSREQFSLKSNSPVFYTPEETVDIQSREEAAALCAAPPGYDLKQLNGLNIGCGDRRISEYLIPIDIMRESEEKATGTHHAFLKNALLANPEELPFRDGTIDYIVALHMLEHIANPMEVLIHWAQALKPGGGIGLILPNYHYTWNAAYDTSQYGHKWNASAEIFRRLYDKHLREAFHLEQINTLPHKISFDVILRKPGVFEPFRISQATSPHSGAELARLGLMVG